MYGDGLTVPQLSLGATEASVVIKDGVGTIEKLEAVSPDGQLSLTGKIQFADPFKKSTIPGCIRFKLSEALKKREKDFGNIDLMLEAKRGDDGFFSFPTVGTLLNMRWKTKQTCAEYEEAEERKKTRSSRPRISTRPKATPANSAAARRAASKDVKEPELKKVGASGPKLDKDKPEGDKKSEDKRSDDVGDRDEERGDDIEFEDDDRRTDEGEGDGEGDDDGDRNDDGPGEEEPIE